MKFREILPGEIFEYSPTAGNPRIMIKTGVREARSLLDGEPSQIHPNKRVDTISPPQPGACALDEQGNLLLVSDMGGGRFRCQRVLVVNRCVLPQAQVTLCERMGETQSSEQQEGVVLLDRTLTRLKDAEKLLESVKVLLKQEFT